jgi:hypothetical protein
MAKAGRVVFCRDPPSISGQPDRGLSIRTSCARQQLVDLSSVIDKYFNQLLMPGRL